MANEIKCPNCGTVIDVESVIAADLDKKYKNQYQQETQKQKLLLDAEKLRLETEQKQFEEKRKNENEIFAEKLQKEKLKMEEELQQQLRKTITADFENKLRLLQQNQAESEEKLKESRKKEMEYLQKEQQLKNKEAEMEINLQKQLQAASLKLADDIRKQEQEKNALKEVEHQLKLKELELKIEEQRKLAEEMKRRAEQGSMQRQGEVQELLLEEILAESFPYDSIEEVGKGVEGADCIQVIKNAIGKECGKIIYESKRTKNWSNAWVDKLKADMRTRGADVALLVTQCFPKDMDSFGEKDGIWICNFNEVKSVAHILRSGILRVYDAHKNEENKGEKMQLLYNYLTGVEFKGQVESIAEAFLAMRNSITKERMQMEKIWKEREKQLDKVLMSTSGLYGSVKGIAGASVGDIPLLDGGNDLMLEDE